jgi:hypothetical protein
MEKRFYTKDREDRNNAREEKEPVDKNHEQ